jgi:hypothetical protein
LAHFAELDADNVVLRVLVVDNNDTSDADGVEDATIGVAFLNNLYPDSGAWIQTSYNDSIRGRMASVGGTYDPDEDIFVDPKAFPSWVRNGSGWEPPIPYVPGYVWEEETVSWVQPDKPFDDATWVEEDGIGYWAPPIAYPGAKDADGLFIAPFFEWDQVAGAWVERLDD